MKKYDGYALVTGGSRGIGLEFSKVLARKGYDLVLVARSEHELKGSAKYLQETYGVKVFTIKRDLSKPGGAEYIRKKLEEKNIHIGILVHNAGVGAFGRTLDISLDKSQHMTRLMVDTPVELTYDFLPDMLKKGNGAVIFTASVVSYFPVPLFNVYASCKAFVRHFGQALYTEYKDKGVDVLVVSPGPTDTQFFHHAGAESLKGRKQEARKVARHVFKKLGKTPTLYEDTIEGKIMTLSSIITPQWLNHYTLKLYYKFILKLDL